MPNMYKSFYLQDLLAMINVTALDTMLGTSLSLVEDSKNENVCVAMYNDGIKDMAKAICTRLTEEASQSE